MSSFDSIIRLNDFRVMKSYFEVNPESSSFDRNQLHLSLDVALLQSNDVEDDMAVQLRVAINEDEQQSDAAGFTGELVVTGFFDVSALKSEHPDDWEALLAYNGVTVLFGTVRTLYAELSSASPVGRILVPTVNVAELLRSQGQDDAGVDGTATESEGTDE